MLNSRERTLTRFDVEPISSYNIFLDGVSVVDGSCTHESNHKDRNPWESMKPVTKHRTGPNIFCFRVGAFLNFGCSQCVLYGHNQPIPSSLELLSIMLPSYSPSSQFISHNTTLSFFPFKKNIKFFLMAQMEKFIAKQNQYKMKGKGEGNTQPAQPRNTLQHSTTLLTHNLCPRFSCKLYT